ncbi:hypothetical protein GCM10011609_79310 [Lentzea pudingi]|uniref:Uncharacterized protein n=1 Tax=Lentzea pudingi TaxID=1789439 RepID=A0ABQ2IPJ6_9PSEU|nr:hypothetical protein [Lentzea pudingi]GGN25180.1 hypothetical protein GCM10011609_79310 [Lentzea pudingi]
MTQPPSQGGGSPPRPADPPAEPAPPQRGAAYLVTVSPTYRSTSPHGQPFSAGAPHPPHIQATCFGGMTLAPFAHNGVVPLDVVDTGLRDAGERGDHAGKPDHGSGPNNVRWVMDGHRQNRASACNTWAAPAGEVS